MAVSTRVSAAATFYSNRMLPFRTGTLVVSKENQMLRRTLVALTAAVALGCLPITTNAFAAGYIAGHGTDDDLTSAYGGGYASNPGYGSPVPSYAGYGSGYGSAAYGYPGYAYGSPGYGYAGYPGYAYGYGNGYPGYGYGYGYGPAGAVGGVIGGLLGGY
jgi:hypothetical protein